VDNIETKAVHAGVCPDPHTGAIMTPIYQTSTYVQSSPGVHKGFEYSRTQNPTRKVLEDNLAALENAKYGLCFSSGMAAIDCVLKILSPSDHIVSSADVYGGTFRLFKKVYEPYGIKTSFVALKSTESILQSITENTKIVWVETPSNPVLQIIDIKAIAALCKKKGILLVVDNTFATPYLQLPINLGADIVVHSATKYLAGHSDVVLGAILLNDNALYKQLSFYQNSCGAIPAPMESFLTLRGVKTLHLRMQRHSENANSIANFLQSHPRVNNLYYPGIETHEGHQIAKTQMNAFGGMISFDLIDDNKEAAFAFLKKLKLFALAESLGGVESLAGHPATMTHASIPREKRLQTGVTDSLIRLSVGIEYIEDLLADLKQALE